MAASLSAGNACILNADIVVSDRLPMAINAVVMKKGQCAISRRWQFDGDDTSKAALQPNDFGIDFFWAKPEIWRGAAKTIPAHYRIGHNSFDTWLLGYFNTVSPRGSYDITPRKVILHPRHEDRIRIHPISPIDDIYTLNCGWPALRI